MLCVRVNKCAFFFITSHRGEKSPLLLVKICPFLLPFLSVALRRRIAKTKNQTNPDELLGVRRVLRPKIIEENNNKKRLDARSGKSGSVTVRFVLRSFFSLCFECTTDRCFLSLSNATKNITAPRFQLTRYYRYGEMDNCEEFWEDFYKSIENHTGKPLPTRRSKSGSKSENDIEDIETKKKKKGQFLSSLKTKCEHFLTKTKENEEENTREEAREARAFARAWQIMDPNEAEVSWRKRYRDLLEKPEEKESGGVSVHNNNEDKDEESPR